MDSHPATWTRFLYGVSWQDPALYDVVLNMEDLSVEGAVATLAGMTRLHDFRPTPESRKAFDDLLLASGVWSALTVDRRTRSANVRVSADAGTVLVTGSAGSARVLAAVGEVAAVVPGVRKVENEVGVGGDWQW